MARRHRKCGGGDVWRAYSIRLSTEPRRSRIFRRHPYGWSDPSAQDSIPLRNDWLSGQSWLGRVMSREGRLETFDLEDSRALFSSGSRMTIF